MDTNAGRMSVTGIPFHLRPRYFTTFGISVKENSPNGATDAGVNPSICREGQENHSFPDGEGMAMSAF